MNTSNSPPAEAFDMRTSTRLRPTFMRFRSYFYSLLRKYLSLFILPQNSVVEVDPTTPLLVASLPHGRITFRPANSSAANTFEADKIVPIANVFEQNPDYLVISGLIHYERNIQGLLAGLHRMSHAGTRLIVVYYSSVWRPFIRLASALGLRERLPESNWLAHEDIDNLLALENFEIIRRDNRVLIPFYLPIISNLVNRYLAPLPGFRLLSLVNILVARPIRQDRPSNSPSVSIVIPARNEAGNIEAIVTRVPTMGPNDEIIFVEGHSTDATWQTMQRVADTYGATRRIVLARQDGKGKGDAVRKGFALANNEILMILDADITVPPEDLSKFYAAITADKGEFINGSRLVYPMEDRAMRFFNLLGNKFFAVAFSFVLGQRFKDTLCGTKVLSRSNYEKLAANRSYFGEFDPFGDFDLLFGASRMGLRIIELPINYKNRRYGDTNISRWRHGTILLAMLFFSARRIKFI